VARGPILQRAGTSRDICNLAAAGQRLQIRHGASNNVVMDERREEEEEEEETMWLEAVEVEWTTESESEPVRSSRPYLVCSRVRSTS
jgi:hypothetical protein